MKHLKTIFFGINYTYKDMEKHHLNKTSVIGKKYI